jgi:hypothetical protein
MSRRRPVVISFTGGMGAQIISAAIYFDLQDQGYDVYACFRYFDEKPSSPNRYSVWEWQLQCFGLSKSDFKQYNIKSPSLIKATYIKDGLKKTSLALQALNKQHIKSVFSKYTEPFKIEVSALLLSAPALTGGYACIHIRRGDYLKVASHLVPDEHFLDLASKIPKTITKIVVVSDSEIAEGFKLSLKQRFSTPIFYESSSIDFAICHYLMTHSDFLICSNSQFSWTAGKLAGGLVLVPKKWFGGEGNTMERLILRESHFLTI